MVGVEVDIMKILITSASHDVKQLLEPLGYLDLESSKYENHFYIEIENVERLFYIAEIVGNLFLRFIRESDEPVIDIYN